MMWKYTPLFVLPPSSVRAVEVFWHDHCWPIIYYNATPPSHRSSCIQLPVSLSPSKNHVTNVVRHTQLSRTMSAYVLRRLSVRCLSSAAKLVVIARVHILRLVTSWIRSAVATGCERVVASDTGGAAATGLEAVVVTSQLTKGIRLQLASV